ncbi:MAG: hypothetical protein PF961_00945 [Planctomycetota bacterium]|jgi:ABC-type transporter Mla MlaB component|nr:hypothetical protein [Planctomycetota bacterium]
MNTTASTDICLTVRVHALSPLPEAGRLVPDLVLLDVKDCQQPDSATVSRLISLYQRYRALGTPRVEIINASAIMREILTILDARKVLACAA